MSNLLDEERLIEKHMKVSGMLYKKAKDNMAIISSTATKVEWEELKNNLKEIRETTLQVLDKYLAEQEKESTSQEASALKRIFNAEVGGMFDVI